MGTLHEDVAWGCWMGTFHGDVAWGRWMGTLDGALHRDVVLHGDIAGGHRPGRWMGVPPALTVPPSPSPAPPQARIVPSKTGNARAPVLLTCHVWGFYPAEVTVIWLRNGDVVGRGDHPAISAIPNGDWTYQTQVTLMVAPVAGDTFTCSVQHASLDQPLLEDWSELGWGGDTEPHPDAWVLAASLLAPRRVPAGPGLSPGLALKVAAATVVMALGLGFFVTGVYLYRARPLAPGEWLGRGGDGDSDLGGDRDSDLG